MDKLWNPFDETYRVDPYSMYQRLRTESPVYRSQSGDIVLTRYSDVKNILLNNNDFRSGNRLDWMERQVRYLENKDQDLKAILEAINSFVVMMDPPEHTQLRTTLMEAWDNRDVDLIIKENIEYLFGKIQGDHFDLIKDFAEPLPVMTMTQIMGMPTEDYKHLKKIAAGVMKSLDIYVTYKDLVQIDASSREFVAYLNQYLDYREANLSVDLVSKVIRKHKENNVRVSRKQMISICLFLFMAGEETTVNLIGTGILALLNNPHQCKLLNSNPDLLDTAVDEALRFESPVQLVGRIANKDCQLNGIAIKKNDTITACLGAANHDPEIFQNPGNFDITHNAKNHLAFGAGIHFCLGSWLAKKQWKMAVHEVLQRFPTMKVMEPPSWNNMLSVRGLSSLKISLR